MPNVKSQFKYGRTESNNGSTFVKPEECSTHTFYTFTFNPESQPKTAIVNSIAEWFKEQLDFICRRRYSKYRLYMEISRKGRLHFHGVMLVTDVFKFYYYDVPDLMSFGHCEMDTINGPLGMEYWLAYCTKQHHMIQDFLYDEINPKIKNKKSALIEADNIIINNI